jgi:hypothetical protein
MGLVNFAGALAVGAAALAWWLDSRFAGRRPASPVARITHALAAYVLVRLAAAVTTGLLGTDASAAARTLVILGLVLPGLVYAFVTALWLMRTLAEAVGALGR